MPLYISTVLLPSSPFSRRLQVSFRAFRAPLFSISAFQFFSFSLSLSLFSFQFSVFSFSFYPPPLFTRAYAQFCHCTGSWNVFHSLQTLALALDTDPGVEPNQKQKNKLIVDF
jgi:hypothetical protein